ncbi:MAG: cystathionine gamma-lyase [Acidimicrobiia bacterium]|nr:cystathionine gamma-lyase [Acidimicrobiia bacterium]
MNMFNPDETAAALLHHRSDQLAQGDAIRPPIVAASLYKLSGQPSGDHQYGRWTNPTWTATEEALSILEGAAVVSFPSGMAAIAAVLLSQLRAGHRLLLPSDGYYTSRLLADRYLAPNGVEVDQCPVVELADRAADGYDLVFIETPSNPTLDLCDLQATIEAAKSGGALTVVDNTTMTPLGQRPFDHGADVVVSSDTKAINGHSDVLFGHVACTEPELVDAIGQWRTVTGAIPGHFESWLVHRGLETFELRFSRMCQTARTLAERLEGHQRLRSVRYPGLPSHAQHHLASRQMRSGGTLVGLEFESEEAADHFAELARYVVPATSFGGTHTTADRRARWGDQVAPGFVRLSVGCEPTEELWKDISTALERL